MTDAVAGCAFQQHGVLNFSLARRRFQNDVLNAVAHLHYLATEICHGRRKKQVLILTFCIKRRLDLSEGLDANEFAGSQIEWLNTVATGGGPRNGTPRSQLQEKREFVVNSDHQTLRKQQDGR